VPDLAASSCWRWVLLLAVGVPAGGGCSCWRWLLLFMKAVGVGVYCWWWLLQLEAASGDSSLVSH